MIQKITWLERQAQIVTTKVCTVEAIENCADWQDQGYNKCVQERDDGYNRCDQTRDEGYNACCDWAPCSWFCDAWVWVSNIVCVVWTWVSNIVCVVWNWVSKWVCRIFHWVWTTLCKLIVSIVFWFIRRVLLFIIFIPCRFHEPDLDKRIKHIFVLVLENRSFDHMFGATPIRGTDAETWETTQIVRRPDDAYNDVLDTHDGHVIAHCPVGTGQKRAVDADPGHEFGNTLLALGGLFPSNPYPPYPTITNSGFAQSFHAVSPDHPETVMLSYTEDDVPVIQQLAHEFAICDGWFSSMPGPTWPNRLFFHAASAAGLDDSPSGFDSTVDALAAGILFDNGTIFDLLDSENIDWSVYEGDHFPQVKALSGMDVTTILDNFHDMDDFEQDLADGSIANYVFIEPDYGDDITGNTFRCGNSQHPLDDVTNGERLIKRVYEAIRNSPVWNQSLLVVTYDEGGGFYDHQPPGKTVHPGDSITDIANDHHDFDFTQLGVRVPAIVCSPWIPRNVIDHRQYEHATVPATIERLWGLPHLTDRDAHARDLVSLLSLGSPRTDAPTTLVDAAPPELDCGEKAPSRPASPLPRQRIPGITLLDPVTQAQARQRNATAITSSVGGFLRVALRLDLMSAPAQERQAIYDQVRGFATAGEVGAYGRLVTSVMERGAS
jgi:phospholipase C